MMAQSFPTYVYLDLNRNSGMHKLFNFSLNQIKDILMFNLNKAKITMHFLFKLGELKLSNMI